MFFEIFETVIYFLFICLGWNCDIARPRRAYIDGWQWSLNIRHTKSNILGRCLVPVHSAKHSWLHCHSSPTFC